MAKHGKRYIEAAKLVDPERQYEPAEAAALVKKTATAKFDQTIEVHIRLGVDPRQSDEMVRGTIGLPHGTGKRVRIAVFAQGEKANEATKAGADEVGAADLIAKVDGGWTEFDVAIATPDMMVAVSKVGKLLGPRGLMPNPKLGTVTMDVAKAVKEQKMGKVEYRTEKTGIVHAVIGKKSFGAQKLNENFNAMAAAILRAKPPTSKGTYLQRVTLSTTMSPGITLDSLEVAQITG